MTSSTILGFETHDTNMSFELQKGIQLEQVWIAAYKYLSFFTHENNFVAETPFISESLKTYLKLVKARISIYGSQWDVIKKYTNIYEFVHTCLPGTNRSVCSYRPISRSFFKLTEILQAFGFHELMQSQEIDGGIKTFSLCEGPGGFVESLWKTRNNKNDVYYGMTLQSDRGSSIPNWRMDRLSFVSSFVLEKGQDGTGNLLSLSNLQYCKNKYANSMDVITADGGFDFSLDFESQERDMLNLLFAEVCFAIIMQRHQGTFILKIFDSFLSATVDILFILSSFYQKVSICKPRTSRQANSEKYVVCTGFIPQNNDDSYEANIFKTFEAMLDNTMLPCPLVAARFLSIEIPYAFYKCIEEVNSVFGQQQLETILQTINLIELRQKWDRAQQLQRTNTLQCVEFCINHKLPFYKR